jgi:hypothetical protein
MTFQTTDTAPNACELRFITVNYAPWCVDHPLSIVHIKLTMVASSLCHHPARLESTMQSDRHSQRCRQRGGPFHMIQFLFTASAKEDLINLRHLCPERPETWIKCSPTMLARPSLFGAHRDITFCVIIDFLGVPLGKVTDVVIRPGVVDDANAKLAVGRYTKTFSRTGLDPTASFLFRSSIELVLARTGDAFHNLGCSRVKR